MSAAAIGWICIVGFFLLTFGGVPIAFSFAIAGFGGSMWLLGLKGALTNLRLVPFDWATVYTFTCIPLFILLGYLAHHAGITSAIYDFAYKLLGRLRGGIAMATVVACGFFAAICASSVAAVVAMGAVALGEMKKFEYSDGLRTGVIAAGGTIGIMIPPSLGFIFYGVLAEQSVGKLFMAGLIPGILMTAIYCLTVFVYVTISPQSAPKGPRFTFREISATIPKAWAFPLVVLAMLGGIYGGIFTPTEAGAIGAAFTFVIALANRGLDWRKTKAALTDVCLSSGMLFTLLIGAMIFATFLALTRLPTELAAWIAGLGLSRLTLLVAICVMYIFLGCAMDCIAAVVLTLPLVLPLLTAMGVDLIWFGVVMVLLMELALITPPIGLNVFVLAGMLPEVRLETIFKGILPFVIADLVLLVMLIVFPQIALFLPNMMIE